MNCNTEAAQLVAEGSHSRSRLRLKILASFAALIALVLIFSMLGTMTLARFGFLQPAAGTPTASAKLLQPLSSVRLQRSSSTGKASSTIAQTCVSNSNESSLPIAHVRGMRSFLSLSQNSMYYNIDWECASADGAAFVEGGMVFNSSDRSLQVPQCGYYFVSSQVYFQVEASEAENRAVYHQVVISSNCHGSNPRGAARAISYASPSGGSVELPTVTTHSSFIAKLCEGGQIRVLVPRPDKGELNGAPCCPYSLPYATFFDAFLVSSTECA